MDMKPGEALNILIAERVFRLKVELTLDGPAYRKRKRLQRVPNYSEDFAEGWKLASWIDKRTGLFSCVRQADGSYVCSYDYDEDAGAESTVQGESAPHATCLAALALLNIDEAQATD